MKTEARGADRSSLDRAAKTFAAHLSTLRRQHARSLQDMALSRLIRPLRVANCLRAVRTRSLDQWSDGLRDALDATVGIQNRLRVLASKLGDAIVTLNATANALHAELIVR